MKTSVVHSSHRFCDDLEPATRAQEIEAHSLLDACGIKVTIALGVGPVQMRTPKTVVSSEQFGGWEIATWS